jgi:hypothetical protein
LLHYVPERRGQKFDIVEDVLPLYNVRVRLSLPEGVEAAELVPEGVSLSLESDGETVSFTLPELVGHAMVRLS